MSYVNGGSTLQRTLAQFMVNELPNDLNYGASQLRHSAMKQAGDPEKVGFVHVASVCYIYAKI